MRVQFDSFAVGLGRGDRECLAPPASAHPGNDPDSDRYGDPTNPSRFSAMKAVDTPVTPVRSRISMSQKSALQQRIHDRRIEVRLQLAKMICDHPPGPERTTAAEVFIRGAMFDFAVGDISESEQRQIFEILSFAVPVLPMNVNCSPEMS